MQRKSITFQTYDRFTKYTTHDFEILPQFLTLITQIISSSLYIWVIFIFYFNKCNKYVTTLQFSLSNRHFVSKFKDAL